MRRSLQPGTHEVRRPARQLTAFARARTAASPHARAWECCRAACCLAPAALRQSSVAAPCAWENGKKRAPAWVSRNSFVIIPHAPLSVGCTVGCCATSRHVARRGACHRRTRALCGPGATIFLLVGYDTWERVVDPKYYPEGRRDDALRSLFGTVEAVSLSRASPRLDVSVTRPRTVAGGCHLARLGERVDDGPRPQRRRAGEPRERLAP